MPMDIHNVAPGKLIAVAFAVGAVSMGGGVALLVAAVRAACG